MKFSFPCVGNTVHGKLNKPWRKYQNTVTKSSQGMVVEDRLFGYKNAARSLPAPQHLGTCLTFRCTEECATGVCAIIHIENDEVQSSCHTI